MEGFISRKEWKARSPKRGLTKVKSTLGTKIHYMAGYVNPSIIDSHIECYAVVRGIQNYHMDKSVEPYSDIGYNGIVCAHGGIFVGRGPHIIPAANGKGLNTAHYALCAILGQEGLTEPTTEMVSGLRSGIAWLRTAGHAGPQILGHRDGYNTSCPGDPLYRLIHNGSLDPERNPASMGPDTRIEISGDFDDQFSRSNYPAGYLWQGSVAETRRTKAIALRVEHKLIDMEQRTQALAETVDSLVAGVERVLALVDSRPVLPLSIAVHEYDPATCVHDPKSAAT